MKRHDLRLAAARDAALLQRERLRQRLGLTSERLRPARLKFDAEQAVEQRISDGARIAVDSVKAHPIAASAGMLAVIAWTLRDPLIEHGPAKLRSGWDWIAGHLGFSSAALADPADDDAANETTPPPSPAPGETED